MARGRLLTGGRNSRYKRGWGGPGLGLRGVNGGDMVMARRDAKG